MRDINTTIPGEIGIFNAMIASGPVIIRRKSTIEGVAYLGKFETLLVKHGDKPIEELMWKFPGGKAIKGLSPEENAIREAKEEIGLDVRLTEQLPTIFLWNEAPETGNEKPDVIVLIHYLAKIDGEPVAGPEIVAMEWFDIDDLPNDCRPNVVEIIEGLRERKDVLR